MSHCNLHFTHIALIGFLLSLSLRTSMALSATPKVISLEEAIQLAVEASLQIKEEQFGVLIRKSQRQQADAARFAQFDITIMGGLSPRRGAIKSTRPIPKAASRVPLQEFLAERCSA